MWTLFFDHHDHCTFNLLPCSMEPLAWWKVSLAPRYANYICWHGLLYGACFRNTKLCSPQLLFLPVIFLPSLQPVSLLSERSPSPAISALTSVVLSRLKPLLKPYSQKSGSVATSLSWTSWRYFAKNMAAWWMSTIPSVLASIFDKFITFLEPYTKNHLIVYI